jgi:hypothetical protein
MTTEQPDPLMVGAKAWVEATRQRVIEWADTWDMDELPDIQLWADLAAFEQAIRAETAAPLEEALREIAALGSVTVANPWDALLTAISKAERALSSPGGGEAWVSVAPSIPGDAP